MAAVTWVSKNDSREHAGAATQLEKLMVRKSFRVRGVNEFIQMGCKSRSVPCYLDVARF